MKNKKIIYTLICLLTLGFISSCQKKDINQDSKVDKRLNIITLQSNFSRAGQNTSNQTFEGENFKSYYYNNGVITINNITKTNNKWDYNLTQKDLSNIKNYYCIVSNSELNFDNNKTARLQINNNQNQKSVYDSQSILYSNINLDNNSLNINFKHAMSKISIKISSEDNTNINSVEVYANTSAIINFNGNNTADVSNPSMQWINMYNEGNGVYSALIPSQTLTDNDEGYFLKITSENNTKNISINNLNISSPIKTVSGKITTFNITLSRDKITISNPENSENENLNDNNSESNAGNSLNSNAEHKEFTLTIKGGQGSTGDDIIIPANANDIIDLPEPSKKFKKLGYEALDGYAIDVDNNLFSVNCYVPFKMPAKNTILYTCWNFTNPEILMRPSKHKNIIIYFNGVKAPAESDWHRLNNYYDNPQPTKIDKAVTWSNGCGWYDTNQGLDPTCWIATASNILTWWINNNAKEISRFIQQDIYKQSRPHKIPYEYTGYNGSEIYNYIHERLIKYNDNGGDPRNALTWFFDGTGQLREPGGGFFYKVFSNKGIMTTLNNPAYYNVTQFCDEAIDNGEIMSLVLPYSGGAHVITVWGVEYDENGYVKAFIVSNSNDTALSWTKAGNGGLKWFEVGRLPEGEKGDKKRLYFTNYTGNATTEIPLIKLSRYSLGKEVWKDFFKKHANEYPELNN